VFYLFLYFQVWDKKTIKELARNGCDISRECLTGSGLLAPVGFDSFELLFIFQVYLQLWIIWPFWTLDYHTCECWTHVYLSDILAPVYHTCGFWTLVYLSGIFAPVMLMPQQHMSAQNVVDLMNQCNINNQRMENNQNSGFTHNGNTRQSVSDLGMFIVHEYSPTLVYRNYWLLYR